MQVVNGLIVGSFYALVALGFSMVYGIIKLINFAHGDIYMFGAFITFLVFSVVGTFVGGIVGVVLAIMASMVFCAALGFTIQRVAYKPLFDAPRLSLLITAVGVSLVLYNTVMVITGGQFMFFTTGMNHTAGINIGPHMRVTYVEIALIATTVALMLMLTWFIGRTMWGKAMRAISEDKDACRLMGINVSKIIGITFMLGSALAAIAGGMAAVYYGQVHFFMGYVVGMKAFTAAVIGGIGSIPGAMLGGLLLGLLEAAGTQIVGSEWRDVFAFGLLIIMLIFRPNGILGKTTIERM
jgi:branched-chain amino acid transport system permease protein